MTTGSFFMKRPAGSSYGNHCTGFPAEYNSGNLPFGSRRPFLPVILKASMNTVTLYEGCTERTEFPVFSIGNANRFQQYRLRLQGKWLILAARACGFPFVKPPERKDTRDTNQAQLAKGNGHRH